MQRFLSVPCRTSGRSSLLSSTQTAPTSFRSFPRQIQSIAGLGAYTRSLRYLRRSIIALSVPATMLAASVLPAAPRIESSQQALILAAAPAEHKLDNNISFSTPSVTGSIALGAPEAENEQAPRVATPSHDAAALALEHVGARYRYGGASPSGFDCSGLTMYVYGQLGVELPHKASAQINERFGQPIDTIEALAPGDLVFFKRTTRARGITHVALYVGDGMMVSANTPKTGVQHVSIYSAYWQSRFAGGLRPYR